MKRKSDTFIENEITTGNHKLKSEFLHMDFLNKKRNGHNDDIRPAQIDESGENKFADPEALNVSVLLIKLRNSKCHIFNSSNNSGKMNIFQSFLKSWNH